MLGESGRGRHIHSTQPSGAISVLTSQSDRKAYSAIGGNMLARVAGDPVARDVARDGRSSICDPGARSRSRRITGRMMPSG